MTTPATFIDHFIAPPCDYDIHILYQDDDIVLIDKPSGLLSLSGKNPLNWDSVHYRLVQGQFIGLGGAINVPALTTSTLVHRLDFGTSGVMVVALNKRINGLLTKQFQDRAVRKHYIAILQGELNRDHGFIDHPIAKDKPNFPLQKICYATGKPAHSEYEVLERLQHPSCCRVRFTPHTGRTHQLRIHSFTIGHPILGCDLYKSADSEQMATRLLLHASELEFNHPVTGQQIIGVSPCPF